MQGYLSLYSHTRHTTIAHLFEESRCAMTAFATPAHHSQNTHTQRRNKTIYMMVFLLAAAAFALYARTLAFEYVWDDLSYAKTFHRNTWAHGVWRALRGPVFKSAQYYRPLGMVSFALLPGAAAQHAINALLHALNTALVFLLARAFMPRQTAASASGLWAAALAALVFAAHPAAVEAVAWVSGRFDTLMLSFMLACCFSMFRAPMQPTWRHMVAAVAFFTAAVATKEAAVGLPVALPFLLLLHSRLHGENIAPKTLVLALGRWLALLALALGLYAAARAAAMPTFFAGSAKISFAAHEGWLDKINIAALAAAQFVRVLLEPWAHTAPMHPFDYQTGSALLPQAIAAAAAIATLVALAWLRLNIPLAFLAALAMGWPALRLIGFINRESIFSNRYALAPLALLTAALAAVAATWLAQHAVAPHQRRRTAGLCVAGVLWVAALGASSHSTIAKWKNEPVFWEFAHRTAPASELGWKNYILVALLKNKQWKQANAELERFLLKYPVTLQRNKLSLKNFNDWIWIRTQAGNHSGALELAAFIEQRLALDSSLGKSPRTLGAFWRTRGIIEGRLGRWLQAERFLEQAVRIDSDDVYNIFYHARALHMIGQARRADDIFSSTFAKAPKDIARWAQNWRKGWAPPLPARNATNKSEEYKERIKTLAQQLRWDEALATLRDFEKKQPAAFQKPDAADIPIWALVRARTGDTNGAQELLARFGSAFEQRTPRSVPDVQALAALRRVRGLLAAEAGHWPQAAAALERAVRAAPEERHSALRWAEALHMSGHTARAQEVFASALDGAPEDLTAWATAWRRAWAAPLQATPAAAPASQASQPNTP